MSASFRVLMVCTANRYRSPLAEHLMADAAGVRGLPWLVSSAGVQAPDGDELDGDVATILADRDIEPKNWRTHSLTAELVGASDLVLTATSAHRAAVVSLDPRALRRTFVLLQFARFCEQLGAHTHLTDGAALMAAVVGVRAELQPVAARIDDLPDPFGAPLATLRSTADRVAEAVSRIVRPLTGDG